MIEDGKLARPQNKAEAVPQQAGGFVDSSLAGRTFQLDIVCAKVCELAGGSDAVKAHKLSVQAEVANKVLLRPRVDCLRPQSQSAAELAKSILT